MQVPQIFKTCFPNLELCAIKALPGQFAPHYHSHYLLGCLISGERTLRVGHKKLILAPFQLLALNPGEIHSCVAANPNDALWLCAHISIPCLRSLGLKKPGIQPLFRKAIFHASQYGRNLADILEPCIQNATHAINSPRLLELLQKIMVNRPLPPERQNSVRMPPDERDNINNLRAYLRANCDQKISLDDLAATARMEKFRFLRGFTALCGISPHRYQEAARIERASSLLRSGSSLCDAAQAAGFYDQSHFNKTFKTCIGLTPGQFQRGFQCGADK